MVKLEVIGHIGKDATVNEYNGKKVINFSVAHSEKYKDASGNVVNKSVWVDCAYWVESTAVAQYLKKGTQVYVEGQPEARAWTSQTGQVAANLQCRVRKVELLGSSQKENSTESTKPMYEPDTAMQMAQPAPSQVNGDDANDLPF